MAVLALSTMLTACSSGGSGGGSSFIPGTGGGGSSIPVTSLPDGSTVPESGTSIRTVNNSQRRTANYENAVEAVGSTTTGVAVLSTKATSNTTAEEINNAYSNMNKILVNQDFANATKEDILLSLAMAGEDIEGLKDKSLDDIKTAAQDLTIKSKAEDVYARLGTERDLSLKDVTFYDPEYALDKADGAIYNFIIDKDGNLTGLQETDDGGASVMKFNRSGNGVYKNNEGLVNYGFVYKDEYGRIYEEELTLPKSTSIDDVKKALKEATQAHWGTEPKETMDAILAFIDTLDLTNGLMDENVCEAQGNCAYKDNEVSTVTVQLDNKGKDVGLKYADFGTITYDIKAGNESGKDIALFYGGYDKLSAKASNLPQDTTMNFEGKALANVESDDISKLYNGTANLTFEGGKETLVADFTDWHKVTIETDDSKPSGYAFTFENTPTDTNFTVPSGGQEAVDIKYYGENPKNPAEFAGSAFYEQGAFNAEMVFGGTRK